MRAHQADQRTQSLQLLPDKVHCLGFIRIFVADGSERQIDLGHCNAAE